MLHGELSNQIGYSFAFRCIDFLVKFREDSFADKVMNFFVGKTHRAVIDETVKDAMEYLYRHTEYSVDLIVENKDYTDELKALLDTLPFNRVVLIDKLVQVTHRLNTGDLTLYIDDDEERRDIVSSQYAIPLRDLNQFIKKRRV